MDLDRLNEHHRGSSSPTLLDSLFDGQQLANNSIVGVLVLCCIVAAALMLLCAGFLMYRLCSRTLDGVRRKMTMDFTKAFPNVVAHPKRVYEIQAEEGVYSSSNDMPSEEDQPKEGSLRRQGSGASSRSGESSISIGSVQSPTRSEELEPTRDELPTNFRKKERKIHKDSVCAMVFKAAHPKKPLPHLV
ncbi:unnamed protein product, partial [Mesorhabditis spiculigera]